MFGLQLTVGSVVFFPVAFRLTIQAFKQEFYFVPLRVRVDLSTLPIYHRHEICQRKRKSPYSHQSARGFFS